MAKTHDTKRTTHSFRLVVDVTVLVEEGKDVPSERDVAQVLLGTSDPEFSAELGEGVVATYRCYP